MVPQFTPTFRVSLTFVLFTLVLALYLNVSTFVSAQGPLQVTAADPQGAEQGTINLNIKVTGKGFKNGAKAKWFVTGTTDPGGVTVNSTTFVSSSELTANITIADSATIANFDIQILNADGRGGKGTELFSVTQKGNAESLCTVQPLPSGISLVSSFNYVTGGGAAAYGPSMGISMRARKTSLNGTQVVVVGVGSPGENGKLEIFFVDPSTGQALDNSVIGSGVSPQPHITVNYGIGTRSLAVGDVNNDGIPDFVAGSTVTNNAKAVVGSVANGIMSYQSYLLPIPGTATNVGWGVAMGDLNGNGSDIIAVGATGGGTGPSAQGQVSLFSFTGSGFQNIQNIVSPAGSKKNVDSFGLGVTIADVTGTTAKDLIIGASTSIVNGVSSAGLTYVFPGPVNQSTYLTLSPGIRNERFGRKVAAGTVNGDSFNDLLATTGAGARLYTGLISNGQTSSLLLEPASGLGLGWATTEPDISDVNGDSLADVLIGAPNAESGSTCGGVAYLYLSSLGSPLANRLTTSTPVLDAESFQRFGWSTAFAPGTRLFFVGDQGLILGSTSPAGQVYVFKVN